MRCSKSTLAVALIFLLIGHVSIAIAKTVKFIGEDLGYSHYEKKPVRAILFKPKGNGPFPAVVLLHACGGVKRNVSRDWPAFLVDLNYVVLTVDTFRTHGHRCVKLSVVDRMAKDQAQEQDAFGALEYLGKLDFVDRDRIAVMGFSQGAITINGYILYRNPRPTEKLQFKAAISLYGSCKQFLLRGPPSETIPLLQILPEHDRLGLSCQAFANHPRIKVYVLKGAYHAFDASHIGKSRKDPYGNVMRYSAKATSEAKQVVKEFLAEHLKP